MDDFLHEVRCRKDMKSVQSDWSVLYSGLAPLQENGCKTGKYTINEIFHITLNSKNDTSLGKSCIVDMFVFRNMHVIKKQPKINIFNATIYYFIRNNVKS